MTFLDRICAALNDAKIHYAVVGGCAVALHGAVRGTMDVDIAVRWTRGNLVNLERSLHGLGLQSRLPVSAEDVFRFRDEYIANRNLVAWNFYHPERLEEQLDVIINYDLRGKSVVEKRTRASRIPVLDIGHLIEMKRKSGRTQDREDIKALEKMK